MFFSSFRNPHLLHYFRTVELMHDSTHTTIPAHIVSCCKLGLFASLTPTICAYALPSSDFRKEIIE